jgi:hypothetical protein
MACQIIELIGRESRFKTPLFFTVTPSSTAGRLAERYLSVFPPGTWQF